MVEVDCKNIYKKLGKYMSMYTYPRYKSMCFVVLVLCFNSGCSYTQNFLEFMHFDDYFT